MQVTEVRFPNSLLLHSENSIKNPADGSSRQDFLYMREAEQQTLPFYCASDTVTSNPYVASVTMLFVIHSGHTASTV